jgi:hypothetical protein
LTRRFLDVAKFNTLTPLSLPISWKPSFRTVGLKMSSLPKNGKYTFLKCGTDRISGSDSKNSKFDSAGNYEET